MTAAVCSCSEITEVGLTQSVTNCSCYLRRVDKRYTIRGFFSGWGEGGKMKSETSGHSI